MDDADDMLIDEQQVAQAYGVTPRCIHRWEKLGRVPKRVADRPNYVRWSKNEIQADIKAMRQASRQEAMT